MWWVQAVVALTASRSPLRRPHRVEVASAMLLAHAASRSPSRHPHHSPVPRGGHRRGLPSSPPSPALSPPPVPLPPPPVPTWQARGTRRSKAALSWHSGEARDDSVEASCSRWRARCMTPWRAAGVGSEQERPLVSSAVCLPRHGVR
jgi:hypothetical protein